MCISNNIMMNDFSDNFPVYTVFVLFLIIASNYIGELFPCKVQDILASNVYLKHVVAFLTMLFFVVLSDPSLNLKLEELLYNSLKMYIVFLFLINCNKTFFIFALFLLGLCYILHLKKNDLKKNVEDDQNNEEVKNKLELFTKINNITIYLLFIVLIVGLIIYMGEKKIEYQDTFNYVTFIFGKPSCRGKSPNTKYLEAFSAAFR